jgi:YD repeat-containing protein
MNISVAGSNDILSVFSPDMWATEFTYLDQGRHKIRNTRAEVRSTTHDMED